MAHQIPTFRERLQSSAFFPFAHRGAGEAAPENTIAAFRAAVDLGYPCIETDIQASRDGTAYAFHDSNLARLTGADRDFSEMSDTDIATLRIKGQHTIPKMSEMFEEFPNTLFNIDAKTRNAIAPMAKTIRQMERHDHICVGSFSDARIKSLLGHIQHPVCHGVGFTGAATFILAAKLRLRRRYAAHCVQLPIAHRGVTLISKQTVDYAHASGLKLHVWTVNDELSMHHLLDLGVDGIMSDNCTLLKSVLQSRDLWPA